MKLARILLSFGFVLWFSAGCSTIDEIDASTPEGAFRIAEEYEKDERYEEAVQRFQEVRTKHPYSKLATEAELRIADVHMKREAFAEAAASYQLFKEFHPKHPRADYVTFQLAMSHFQQLPSTVDRDLAGADKAIQYFDEVINVYPSSAHVPEAKTKKDEALRMLAQKELYIADFYFKRKTYDSALGRYEHMLKTYANLGYDQRALYGAARSALETGQKDRGIQHYQKLISLFPSSEEARKAKNEFSKFGVE